MFITGRYLYTLVASVYEVTTESQWTVYYMDPYPKPVCGEKKEINRVLVSSEAAEPVLVSGPVEIEVGYVNFDRPRPGYTRMWDLMQETVRVRLSQLADRSGVEPKDVRGPGMTVE